MKVSEFLAEVRDELATHWTKRTMRNEDGEVCTRGAVRRVAARHLNHLEIAAAADKALLATFREATNRPTGSIESINDCSNQQNVLDMVDKVIIKAEETGR